MAHDEDTGCREGLREEISRQKIDPAGYVALGYEFLEDGIRPQPISFWTGCRSRP
jgi:hypothetical protein